MPVLSVGEPAPWFAVPRTGGSKGRVILDELAGRYIVLFLYGSSSDPIPAQALSDFGRHPDIFDGDRCLFIGVGIADGPVPQSPGQHFGLDVQGTVARQYGLVARDGEFSPHQVVPTAFVLGPGLQILEIVSATGPAAFVPTVLSALDSLRTNAPPVHDAPVLVVPQVFDRAFCARLIELYEASGGREIGAVEVAGAVKERFDPAFRKRLDWYVSDEATLEQCKQLLARRLLPMVQRAFQFRTTRIERYLVGCYDAETGGHFHAHRDNTAIPVAHRRFAVTLNLNDGYVGGDLRFPEFGTRTYRAGVGDAAVFSCSLLHEVTPITCGTRYAFLSFLYDEAGQRIRDEYARRITEQAS